MKHTIHSRQRTQERTSASFHEITEKLRKRQFIGLPRQTLNRRVSLITIRGEHIVAIWAKTTGQVITVLTLEQYLNGNSIPENIRNELMKIQKEATMTR